MGAFSQTVEHTWKEEKLQDCFDSFSKLSVDAGNLYLISCVLAKNLFGDCKEACFCPYKNTF